MNDIKKIQALRDFCDFAEKSEVDFDLPGMIYLNCNSQEKFSENVKKMGSFDKNADDGFLNAEKRFGDKEGFTFQVFIAQHRICKSVVTKKIVPFKAAKTLPEVPEHEEDIVEWECPESFLDIKKETVSV